MTAAVGNRCGHDPEAIRLELARATSSRRLKFISEAMDAIKGYATRAALLVELEADRQRRSERREAIVLVGQALVYRMDLRSLRVGEIQPDGSCKGIEVDRLAEWTGLHPGRVARALADLRDAGYETSTQPYELDEATGKYKGLAAIRVLTVEFFRRLGLSWKLARARKKATERWQARRAAALAANPVDYRTRRSLRRLARGARERERRLTGGAATAAPAHSEERMRRWNALLLVVRDEHPDWPLEAVRAEATARLRG